MLLSTDLFQTELETINIDSSVIDVSEVKDEADQSFLITQGHELLRIDAKAEQAKEIVSKKIDRAATNAKGKIIYEIQERMKGDSELLLFYHSLGFWKKEMEAKGLVKPEKHVGMTTAINWSNSYRAALEMQEKLKGLLSPEEIQERADAIPMLVKAKSVTALSTSDRENLYLDIADGQDIGVKDINSMSKQTATRLSKAEELLEAARQRKKVAEERWEMVKSDPSIPSKIDGQDNPEYRNAQSAYVTEENSLNTYSKKVAELEAKLVQERADMQAQIEEEKVKTAEETEAKKQAEAESARLETELQKLKFDDAKVRAERVKKLSTTLTVSIPQVTADVSKFFAEINCYKEEHRKHIYENAKALADKIGDCL